MDKKPIFLCSILFVFILIIAWAIYSDINEKYLCVYKIPNELIYNCSGKEVVSFGQNLFKHNNAIELGCSILNQTEDYGYSYEINECGFNSFYFSRLKIVK